MARRRTRPRHGRFSRYAAPLAFLTAVTVAVLLVASALNGNDTTTTGKTSTASPPAQTTTNKKPRKQKQQPARYYVVVAGDTFEVIAGKTGTSVGRLESLNPGVSSTSLYVGQKLRVG